MRNFIILSLLLVAACTAPPEDIPRAEVPEEILPPDVQEDTTATGNVVMDAVEEIPIDVSKSSFTFTGYGPGKSHDGTFTDMEGVLMFSDGQIVGASGVIQAASVEADTGGVTKHLQTADFFDVETYPTIEMESMSITGNMLTGKLTFHGVANELTFPVTVDDSSVAADVIISLADFGIEYTGVNDEVRIQFSLTT